jgi:hypothetical protein
MHSGAGAERGGFPVKLGTVIQKLCEALPLLSPKFQHVSRFEGKCLLDNTTGIRYLNESHRLPKPPQ